jgi:putative peptidoglycan lipid II flippase
MKSEHHQISRRVGTLSFFTGISRVLGLVRDAVLAFAFGATGVADAFYVAFRIPNMLRRLVAEGALTVAFVPIYTEYLKKSRKQAHEVASVVFTFLALFLAILVILGVLFAPWIVKAIAYGFGSDPAKYNLTVYLTRLMFPYIFLISLVALAMGILNSLKRFAAPAAAPILLNLGIIAGALVLSRFFTEPTVGLAIGVLIGGIMQLALQIPWLAKEGMLPRISFKQKHPALKSLVLMMIPSAYGAAIYQFNVLVITLLASFLPSGSVSYLWYADRISEFPLGIFAVSVAVATLPTLSDHAAEKDIESFKSTINYSLRLAFLISIPAAIGLFMLAMPIIQVIYQRGVFDQNMAVATAGALQFFALGIPFVSADRNLVPAFFAIRKPKVPVTTATIALIINAIAALILMHPLKHMGLALALSISSCANFFMLFTMLTRRVGALGVGKLMYSVARTIAASAVMALFIYGMVRYGQLFNSTSLWTTGLQLFLLIAVSVMVFVGSVWLINREDFEALMSIIKRRKKAKAPVSVGPVENGQ